MHISTSFSNSTSTELSSNDFLKFLCESNPKLFDAFRIMFCTGILCASVIFHPTEIVFKIDQVSSNFLLNAHSPADFIAFFFLDYFLILSHSKGVSKQNNC